MTKLSELPTDFYIEYYRQLPRIDRKEVKLLWHHDYYDGPLNGTILYQGKIHWFQIFKPLQTDEVESRVDENETVWNDYFCRYLIIELSDEQIREEEYWHELFRQKVGTHTDYDENEYRKISEVKPREIWKEFYEPYATRKIRELSNNRVIGWFEDLQGSIKQRQDE